MTHSPSVARTEIVFVFDNLPDWQTLARGASPGAEVVVLDGTQDGLAQIAAHLQGREGVDAIHILSHGQPGSLQLGSLALDQVALAGRADTLTQIGGALSDSGDILLYGCQIGDGVEGARFMFALATLTQADIAASIDNTGGVSLGGNWVLEAYSGRIETELFAATPTLNAYSALLAAPTSENFDGVAVDGTGRSLGVPGEPRVINGWTFSLLNAAGGQDTGQDSYVDVTRLPGDTSLADDGSDHAVRLNGTYVDGSSGTQAAGVFKATTGDEFSFVSMTVENGGAADTYRLVGYRDGSAVSGATHDFIAPPFGNNTVVSVSGSQWQYLDEVRIVQQNGAADIGIYIDDIVVAAAVPPVPVVTSAALSADTGTSSTDFITHTASQTISGTLSANLGAGEKVEVSYDNGGTWSNATSYTVGTSAWSTTTTLAGSNTFQARVTNAGGDSGTAYTHTYTLDTTSPSIIFTGIVLSADTGTSSSDLITNTASQTISATLSGPPTGTDVVWGSVDSGDNWTKITNKVVGTALSWDGVTLLAGTNALMFKVTDEAGNDSALSFQNYRLDTTAPTATVATAAFSSDTGTSSTDFITNDAAQTISGTLSANLASGDKVYVSIDNGATWAAAVAAVGQDTWSIARTLTASSTLRVKVSDVAGNDSTALLQVYQYDASAPTTTLSGLALSADTGASATDFITKTASQTITATLSDALAGGDILYGSLDNGAHWTDITSKVSGTSLAWDGVTLTGSDTLRLKVTDAAGNDGTVRTQPYVLDTTLPAAPSTPVLASASDSGASNSDGITSDNTPTFTGTGEDGSTVSIYDGATLLGIATVVAGNWSFTAGALSNASHTITAVATDTAGNPSAPSAGLTITVDTAAPTVASVAVPTNGTYYSGGTLDFTVNFDEVVTVDTTGGTPSIAITVGTTNHQAVYVSGSSSSALLFRYTVVNGDADADGIAVGALSLNSGSIKDTAGNNAVTTLNAVATTTGVNVDGSQPSITNVSASTSDGAYGAGQTVTITVDFSSAVNVDTSGGTPTLALDGGGSAAYTGGSGGTTLTFSYVVGAGQNSADLDVSSTNALALYGATIIEVGGAHQNASVVLATPGTAGSLGANKDIIIDTTAPTNVADAAIFSADTGSSGTDLITKTAAQTVSGTLASNLAAGEHVYVSLDNGNSWDLAATTVGTKGWSLAGVTLTGSDTLKVRITDDAGNDGTAYTQTYVLDTTAPTTSFSGIALSADTGVAGDLITNTAAQTVTATLSGAPAAGDVVYGSLDNGATWTDVTSKVSGTTLSWTGVTLAASDTLRLRVVDAAGNTGAATSAAYVLDTTAPTTSVASVAFSADSGTSGSDFITKTAAQTVSGTLSANLAAGETVQVSLDNGAIWTVAIAAVGATNWSLAGQTLTASDTLLVKVVDLAGNDGAVFSQAYVYDTAATVPSVDPLTSTSLTPVLTGAAALAAGETLTVTVGGATYDVVPVTGAWSLDLAAAVPTSGTLTLVLNHRYEVVATVADLAGNVASDTTASELLLGTLPVTPDPEPPVTPPTPNPPTPGIPDNDGIPATVEDQAPGIPGPGGATPVPGDGNGDGIKDSEQASVASIGFVLSPTGESNPGNAPLTFTTLVASSVDGKVSGDAGNVQITSLSQKDAPADLPHGMEMPIGLVSFTATVAAGHSGETFSLYVDASLDINGYWKQDSTGTWVNIASEPYGGKMVMEGGKLRLDFHIEDGGQFDADGKVDGIITDPGAPAHMPLSIVGQAPDVVHNAFWF